jgi:hypothetical protein
VRAWRWAIVRAEWASLRLARRCGILTPEATVETVAGKDVLLIERFDRATSLAGTRRLQRLSALTLLDLDDTGARLASYPALAELLRRHARDGTGDARQLFRRMAFNVLIGNADDHAKNHAAFWDGQWLQLTPAYDLVPRTRAGQEANPAMIGQFRLHERGKDPAPIHELVEGDIARQQELGDEEVDEGASVDALPGSTEFALEKDLQRHLADNLFILEPGLTLFEDEDISGFEYPRRRAQLPRFTLVRSSAARSDCASFCASSFAQKCMKYMWGDSSIM